MFSTVTPEYFNVIEGCFWIILGLACFFIYLRTKRSYHNLALFSVLVLITFGLSDFVEAIHGSFLVSGMEWLLIWKITDVVGLCLIIVWYLTLRLRSKNSP